MQSYKYARVFCFFSHLQGSPPWSGSQFIIQLRDVALRKQAYNTMKHTKGAVIYGAAMFLEKGHVYIYKAL